MALLSVFETNSFIHREGEVRYDSRIVSFLFPHIGLDVYNFIQNIKLIYLESIGDTQGQSMRQNEVYGGHQTQSTVGGLCRYLRINRNTKQSESFTAQGTQEQPNIALSRW